MKILVIPDIHNECEKVDLIIEREQDVDVIVLLGDYFDDYFDEPEDAMKIAHWLKNKVLKNPKIIPLMGNHDYSYRTWAYNEDLACSGFTLYKHNVIKKILKERDWRKLKYHCIVDGVLYTHAGCTQQIVPKEIKDLDSLDSFLKKDERFFNRKIVKKLINGQNIPSIFRAGRSVGGGAPVGGLIWCRSYEFESLPFVRQIFGHTVQGDPLIYESGDICMDTQLRDYAIVTNGMPEFKKTCI